MFNLSSSRQRLCPVRGSTGDARDELRVSAAKTQHPGDCRVKRQRFRHHPEPFQHKHSAVNERPLPRHGHLLRPGSGRQRGAGGRPGRVRLGDAVCVHDGLLPLRRPHPQGKVTATNRCSRDDLLILTHNLGKTSLFIDY